MRRTETIHRLNDYAVEKNSKAIRITDSLFCVVSILVALIAAAISAVSAFIVPGNDNTWIPWLMWIVAILSGISISLALYKMHLQKKYDISYADYEKEIKINQINESVFHSIIDIQTSKIRSVLRYTYGTVHDWNPVYYDKNVLVYDVHEHIRSILIAIEKNIISIDPQRFNDGNVSVELIYCYPKDSDCSNDMVDPNSQNIADRQAQNDLYQRARNANDIPYSQKRWIVISSGDTSGNKDNVKSHLKQDCSFFRLLESCGTVFRNNKYLPCPAYMREKVEQDSNVKYSHNECFFIEDIKDFERRRTSTPLGSVAGTVITLRNDEPETVFVKAYLVINTYGQMLYEQFDMNEKAALNGFALRDKFWLTEDDYKEIILETIIPTYSKVIEAELAQMFIRHTERNKMKDDESFKDIEAPEDNEASKDMEVPEDNEASKDMEVPEDNEASKDMEVPIDYEDTLAL